MRRKSRLQPRYGCIVCDASGFESVGPASKPESGPAVAEAPSIEPIWRFLAETAIQLTIAGFAVAASVVAKTRFFAFASAFLCVPQVVLSVRRFLRETEIQTGNEALPDTKPEVPEEGIAMENGEEEEPEALINSTIIRSAVAEEVDILRYSIERMETATLQREHARNRSIAEALASLDEGIRAVRRTVETRNQIESSAPFALVAELEQTRSRVKDAEREKVELQVKLQLSESNFNEAKRQGERARREADDAVQRELLLRTELATVSSRLVRLDEITVRLDTAERRNDELREELVSGSREQENLRQSAADAERRVLRVENISRILREKLQAFTGRGDESRKGGDRRDRDADADAEAEDEFWQRRLRKRASLPGPGSLLYQELLGGSKEGDSSKEWPQAPLEGGAKEKKRRAQLENLPADGGFGSTSASGANIEQSDGQSGSRAQLPSSTGDTIFSFSRGEFEGSEPPFAKTPPAALHEEGKKQDEGWDGKTAENSRVDAELEDEPVRQENLESEESVKRIPVDEEIETPGPRAPMAEEARESEHTVEIGKSGSGEPKSEVVERRMRDVAGDSRPSSGEEISTLREDKEALQDATSIGEVAPASASPWSHAPRVGDSLQPSDEEVNDVEANVVSGEDVTVRGDSEIDLRPESVKTDEVTRKGQQEPIEQESAVEAANMPENESEDHSMDAADSRDDASVTAAEAKTESTKMEQDIQSPPRPQDGLIASSQEGSIASEPAVQERSPEDTYSETASNDLSDDTTELNSGRPSSVDAGTAVTPEGNEGNSGERSIFKEGVPVPTASELVDAANELVKKARARGLAVAESNILFKRAISKLEAAMSLGLERAFVQAEFGGILLAWAKVNLGDPAAYTRLTRALGHLSASLDARPDDETTIFNTGLCLCLLASSSEAPQATKYYTRACELYDQLLRINGDSRIGSFNCGLAYISLGRLSNDESDVGTRIKYFETAAERFTRSLELKVGDSKAQSYLEDCNREIAQLHQD